MNVSEAVASRKSIRAFLDKPVEEAIIRRVLDKARFAPSGGNVQPWHAVVLAGNAFKSLRDAVAAKLAANEMYPEYAIYPPSLPEPYRTRRFACGEELYAAIGIPRDDRPARLRHVKNNFTGWNAPVGLFCYTPDYMGKPQWADIGMWLQTIMLLLREEGVDSCAQEAWSEQGRTIKTHLGIAEGHTFFCGMAIGYADPAAPINSFRIGRAPLEESVRFEGF